MSSICPEPDNGASPTRVIAHRGASGYLPEHTAAAKVFAYALGVDFIEQDVIATKDGELIVLHDTSLNAVSDVATRFPGRQREDGEHYAIDFTFDELSTLTLHERRRPDTDELRYPGRYPYTLENFKIMRLEDEIRLISGLNASTGRHVGIYPEIKSPGFHLAEGVDLGERVHASLLANRDYITGSVFVQSFDSRELERLKSDFGTEFSLIQLLEADEAENLVQAPERLAAIAEYAVGVGLPFDTLIRRERIDGRPAATELAGVLADSGLLVHPYTLRRDVAPPGTVDYFDTLRFLMHELRVDAIFCDHPDDAIAVRARSSA